MTRKVIVIAPHPDDETLGCGGTLLRHIRQGDEVHWIIATEMTSGCGFAQEHIEARKQEISKVAAHYQFTSVKLLGFPTTLLDTIPIGDIVAAIKASLQQINAQILYLPHRGDVHTDHRIVFDAAISCAKWFRNSSIQRVLSYETLSETEFGLDPDRRGFLPNVFVDISDHLDQKLEILYLFAGEMGAFPFPRSEQAVRAQASLRGSTAGCAAAEAFMLLKEIL